MNTRLKLREEALKTTPPDKFRFTVPEDGTVIKAFDRQTWFDQIAQHYCWNGYTLPEDWKAIVEDQLCQVLGGEWCEYEGGAEYAGGIDPRFGLEDVLHGTQVLASFTMDGREVVDKELAEQRALTCSRCHMNTAVPGCAACFGLLNVVAAVVGNHETKSDNNLRSCLICKCHNKAQVWVPAEHLAKGVSEKQMEAFRRIPYCWKGLEIDAL